MPEKNLEDILKENTKAFLKSFKSKFRKKSINLSFTDDEIPKIEEYYRDRFEDCLINIENILKETKLFESSNKKLGVTKEKEFIKFYQDYIVFLAKLYDVNYVPLKDINGEKRILSYKDGTMAIVKDDVHKYHLLEDKTNLIEEYGFLYKSDNSEFGLIDEEDDMIAQGNEEIEAVVKKNWKDVLECNYKAKESVFSSITTNDFKNFSYVDNSSNETKNSVKLKKFERDSNITEEIQNILYSLRIVANKGLNFKDDENGQVLKDNFIKFYGIKHYPKYAEAHHIAPKNPNPNKEEFPSANRCKEIVINYLVDINHPCNCAVLPRDERRAKILKTQQHNGPCRELHGKEIMEDLKNDLNICKTVFSVIDVLSNYRLEMLGR